MTFPNQLTDQKRWCHDSWYEATCKNQETRVKTDIAGSWSFSSRQELFLQTFSSFLSSIKPSETVPATSYTNFMRQQTMEFSYFYIMCCDEFFTILIIIMKMNFDKKPYQYCQQLLLSGTINQSKHTEELKQSLSSGTILRVRSR